MKSIAILTGGGPAPGMNTVVASVAKTFLRDGYRVIGLHGGYSALFTDKPRMQELDFLTADEIFNKGGSILKMSRFKPTPEDFEQRFNLKLFTDNEIKLLVTVGGDDTASTANRIAKFLADKHYPIANIHVPKTIDNDLPLPNSSPTFGYNSAKAQGCVLATAVMEDARTSENWFVVSAMGRSAGHLALGIAGACHYPMVIIPEFFNKTEITVDKIINMVVSCIIKRKLMGINYGAAMISEGVFHSLSDEDIFNDLLERKAKEIGLKVKTRPVEVGYEIRCHTPIAFDLTYCSLMGMGVHTLFNQGCTGCMVYVDQQGNVSPLYLKDLQDPATGKIPPRLVNVNSNKVQSYVNDIMDYITPADYEAAKKYVANPEDYDFKKILNW